MHMYVRERKFVVEKKTGLKIEIPRFEIERKLKKKVTNLLNFANFLSDNKLLVL